MRLLLAILLLAGCQARAKQSTSLDAALFDDEVALSGAAADARVRAGTLDVARLRSADSGVYDPTFRILDDNGRLRLIVQDPITHRYKLVR